MLNRKTNVFIISTQAPLKGLGKSTDFRQGKTGQIIKEITGCEMFVMTDDPVDDANAGMLKRNIRNNCWVVITGHGKHGGGFDGIVGATDQYIIDANFLFEETLPLVKKKYSLDKYLKLLTKYGDLKRGDHINLVLLVCCAGKENQNKKSFAEQLGQALATHGVTSCIVANESNVSRLRDPSISEIKMQNKRDECGAKIAEPPFVFMTNIHGKTLKYQAPGDVTLTKDGIVQANVSQCREMYNKSYLHDGEVHKKIDVLFTNLDMVMKNHFSSDSDYKSNKVSFKMFMRGRDEVERLLMDDRITVAICASLKNLDSYRFSYLNKDNVVLHKLVKLNDCEKFLKLLDKQGLWNQSLIDSSSNFTPFGMSSSDSLDIDDDNIVLPGRDGIFGPSMSGAKPQASLPDSDDEENSSEMRKRLDGSK